MSNLQTKLRQLLNNPKVSREQKLAYIKLNSGAGEYATLLEKFQLLKSAKLQDSQFKDITSIKQRNAFEFTNDFKKELFWIGYNIKKSAPIIDAFLVEKDSFERLFFLEKYDEAEANLAKIRHRFGETLWSIEMTLLLKEYKYGTKENWGALSEYLPKLNSPFYQFLLNFYSKKIEKAMSFENCFKQFSNDIGDVHAEEEVTDYLVFKSIFFADYEYGSIAGIIYVGNVFSVIDQYLLTIDILAKQISIDNSQDKTIIHFLKFLDGAIQNDKKIFQIQNLLNVDNSLTVFSLSNPILNIIENYTEGKYGKCIEMCLAIILDFPTCFEIYQIYIKSLIHLKQTHTPLGNLFIDEILDFMMKASFCDLKSDGYRDHLLKKSLLLNGFDFGKQIYAFVSELKGQLNANRDGIISCICSPINNPKLLSLDLGDRYSNVLAKHLQLGDFLSLNVNSYISGNVSELKEERLSVINVLVYRARHFFKRNEYEKVIENAKQSLKENMPPFYKEQMLTILYNSYVETDRLRDALELGGAILIDDFYVNRINFQPLCRKIQIKGFEAFSDLMDLPLVFGNTVSGYDLYVVYDEFMTYLKEDFPSQLDINELVKKYSINRVIYFLKEICVISTLQNSLVFDSIELAEQERHEICLILAKIDPENAVLYNKEIAEILRTAAVRNVIKEVDDGRLFVNIESLKSLQSKGLKETFSRFKEIERVVKDVSLVGYNSSKERNWKPSILVDDNSGSISTDEYIRYNNPAFLAFKSIYQETREKFLFSKEYGLDSCLSTRIRHGALKNHIRSVFEKVSLVTSKTGDIYLDNKKWYEQLGSDEILNHNVQTSLKSFSRDIDDYTTYIVDSLIQIRTEKNSEKKDGLFNYGTSDRALWEFMNEHSYRFTSETDIVDILYSDLSNYTSHVVASSIMSKIVGEFNNTFQGFIEKLQVEIRSFNIPANSDLLTNISKSSTNIQTELDNIAEWFIFRTSESSSLLEIETIIDASKEYTNKINPNNRLNPEIIIDCEPFMGYSHLIFVFNIMMANIIKHSGLSADKLNTKIHVSNIGESIQIVFTNNFSPTMNKSEAERKLNAVKQNWNNHDKIDRSNIEGESGFDKIKRILLYEAHAKSDRFEFLIEESTISVSLFLPFKEYNLDESTDN
ncbi:hypothetical protein H9X96_21885 [Pedobacter sp. N36a]|uniref:hypothetical protein n=1 Tax=Pedobacter sp. N36a TaxID=2767996 RepID=UPI001656A63A|nr:hypothetical protein [Pedobacter sp. N36a]MBC8988410.1 hypothetical protein [Pedobacter sp. N36a]